MGLVETIGVALKHSLWQGALVGLLFATIRGRLRPRARCWAGLLALATLLLATAVTLALHWPTTGAATLAGGNLTDPLAAVWILAAPAGELAEQGRAIAWEQYVVVAWACIATLMTGRQFVAHTWLRRSILSEVQPFPPQWQARAKVLADQVGVQPNLVAGGHNAFTMGWIAPVVVMPVTLFTALPPAQLDLILVHEFMHIRRGDYLAHLLQTLVECLFFYHPAVWLITRDIRTAREMACDADVLAWASRSPHANEEHTPSSYARALTELAALSQRVSPAVAAGDGDLTLRVKAILGLKPTTKGGWIAPLLVVAALLGACLQSAEPAPVDPMGPRGHSDMAQAGSKSGALPVWLPPSVQAHGWRIEREAIAANVEPTMVALMVLVESGGNPTATSPIGALGLMQLMPKTAAEAASELGLTNYDLADPDTNLRLGVQVLANALRAHADREPQEQRTLAWATYNGGPGAVKQYLDGAPLPEETARYVKLLSSLYAQRDQLRSTAYMAWRERVRARLEQRAQPPLPGARLTSPFGKRTHPIKGGDDFHTGVDLAHHIGQPVRAPLAGRVKEVGEDDRRGVYVILGHGASIESRYYHLERASVTEGSSIDKGQKLGEVGNRGVSTGAHLHIEVLDHGKPIDPAFLLGR